MPKQKKEMESAHHAVHTPVLLNEVVHHLSPKEGESYLDLTAGFGGHAAAVLGKTKNPKDTTLVDRDKQAVKTLHDRFGSSGVEVVHSDFLAASKDIVSKHKKFDIILADLGVSSLHLNEASRGFAFASSGPLDMRMDQEQELTADIIVNGWSGPDLARILRNYGEEPKAAEIARRIVAARPIKTTDQLANIVAKAWHGRSKTHPATRTFQALRIVVNSELMQLKESLPLWLEILAPRGRLAVISFHSLEDRIVKQFLVEHTKHPYEAELDLLTKKPVTATSNEIVSNPRARSAKLRACSKK